MPSKELEGVLQHLREVGKLFANPAADSPPYVSVRAAMDVIFTAPPLKLCRVEDAKCPVPAKWVMDQTAVAARRLLFLHGGGYISGGIASHVNFAMWISRATGCAVLLIDYRLAPEHPFPAALDDAVQAFNWLRENGPGGLHAAEKTFVLGDSAGGGLALALLLALRDRKLAQADAAVTFSAWTDVSNSSPSYIKNQNLELGSVKAVADYFTSQYLQGADPTNPLASPLFGQLAGLPPLLMQVSSCELISDDSLLFAEKARAAGVHVDLQIWPDMVHVWQGFIPQLPEASDAVERAGKFFRVLVESGDG
jgi:acetyl esterase/lipase